jgi:drug/metabolite transporter (DMT)-like permease
MATRRAGGSGLALALTSAATFGMSGIFATSLIDIGWTPGAAVATRIALAAVLLAGPAIVQLRRRGGLYKRRALRTVVLYGVFAVGVPQLFFFNAVEHLSVGVALLLEYLGILYVVGWLWLRHGQRPRRLTIAGGISALVGLVLILDLFGAQRVDAVGVVWGLCAGVGLAVYFVMSARAEEPLPPLAMAWSGMTVAAVVLAVAGVAGVLPMHVAFADVRLAGRDVSWLVPIAGVALVSTAVAYVTGIAATRRLQAKVASFVGLTEVLFAVLFAWLFLSQLPGGLQILGGAFIVAGVTLVRVDELRSAGRPADDEALTYAIS